MLNLKSWPLTFVLYAIVILTVFSIYQSGSREHHRHDHRPHDIFLPHLNKREGTQTLFSHIHGLGISGRGIVRFFKRHLLQVIEVDQREKAHRDPSKINNNDIQISQYYDLFRRYLYSDLSDIGSKGHDGENVYNDENNDEDILLKCSPTNSIVSRLTKGVDPVPIHSHNDYWRDLPLFQALAYGCSSIEADVWIVPENERTHSEHEGDITSEFALAVGHNEAYLDPVHQTLDQLYTVPLMDMLKQVNCLDTSKRNGVFYNSPETTLFLYIDFKSQDNQMTYKLLMDKYLKPLVENNYLSFYDMGSGKIVYNQITVILTGNYPTDMSIINNGNNNHGYYYSSKRHVFLDANMLDLDSVIPNASITSSASFDDILDFCHISKAKTLWRGHLVHPEINCIRNQIDKNHQKDLKTRLWGVPNWPKRTAKTLWKQQISDLHSDILNIDNLFQAFTI